MIATKWIMFLWFYLNEFVSGFVDKHNCKYQSTGNCHMIIENSQYSEKINILNINFCEIKWLNHVNK